MPSQAWPFPDPPNAATITTRKIMSGEHAIDYVAREESDGGWQFLNRGAGAWSPNEAMLVSLGQVVSMDSSLNEIGDLPLGWHASRKGKSHPWTRAKSDQEER